MSVDVLSNTVSVEEAATILQVSGQTVRRMVKRGQLRGELIIGPKGKEWRIALDRPESLPVVQDVNRSDPDPGLLALAELLREMHNNWQQVTTENAELREERARLGAEVAVLRERLAATERQQVLSAPRPWWKRWGRA